jgi:hypothetical protein
MELASNKNKYAEKYSFSTIKSDKIPGTNRLRISHL